MMEKRSTEFTELHDLGVLCATWNVNGKKPDPEEDLSLWLKHHEGPPPDIFCIGFQEIVDLTAVNVMAETNTKKMSSKWRESLQHTINQIARSNGQDDSYYLVDEKHLVGIMLSIFVLEKHRPHIKEAKGQTAGVGVMGMMGNKGGATIRLQIQNTSLCFVAAHLAAHRDNVAGRNADFMNILNKTSFDNEPVEENTELVESSAGASDNHDDHGRSYGIMAHDFVFFLGDFNYRIVEGISTDEVFDKVEKKDFAWLQEHDQLNVERAKNNTFMGFKEGSGPGGGGIPPFEPTYKFQPKTSVYERRPDKKLRAPAWCDRILWYARNFGHVEQLSYKSTMQLEISDHKPVSSLFKVQCKTVIVDRKREVHQAVVAELDRNENKSRPKVDLDKTTLTFDEILYRDEMRQSVWVTNTGETNADWSFKAKSTDESALSKQWLTISPTSGLLLPGEKVEISIKAFIENETAHDLNRGLETLEDILVLSLTRGRDYFINIIGSYARSCFGCTLEELVRITKPIREIPMEASLGEQRRLNLAPLDGQLSVPKELWRLVDAIYQKGLNQRNQFHTPGNADEVISIRESLDTGMPFEPCTVYSMTEALGQFLGSLADPIIPSSLLPSPSMEEKTIQPWGRRFLEQLPPVNYNVFVYMISFFREVLHSQTNNPDTRRLAEKNLVANCCTWMVKANQEDDEDRKESLRRVVKYFMTCSVI